MYSRYIQIYYDILQYYTDIGIINYNPIADPNQHRLLQMSIICQIEVLDIFTP